MPENISNAASSLSDTQQLDLVKDLFAASDQLGFDERYTTQLAESIGLAVPAKQRVIHVVVPPAASETKIYKLVLPEGDESTEDPTSVIGVTDLRGSRPAADFFNADGTLTEMAIGQGYSLELIDTPASPTPHRGDKFGGWLDSSFSVEDKGLVRGF